MRIILKICGLLILWAFLLEVKAQNYLDTIPKLIWEQNKFQEALNVINQNRQNANQNIFLLDLYKSTCYCGLEQYQNGQNYFDWILKAYRNMKQDIEDYIMQSKSRCIQQQFGVVNPSSSLLAAITVISPPGPARVIGKEFYTVKPEDSRTKIIQTIPDSVYQSRLYQDINSDTLLLKLEQVGVDSASVHTSNNFIVIIPFEKAQEDVAERISEQLEKALRFYQNFYDVQSPKYKITAYSCRDKLKYWKLSENIHGVKLSESLIGYSSQPDLSMVVYNPLSNAATFKHELLHILFNHNVPYLQPWLAEGIPALYEVSRFRDDSLKGISAWRDELLRDMGYNLPINLDSLLSLDWKQFEEWQSPYDNSLIKACIARTLTLYLQNTGELQNVYRAYRNQDPLDYNPYLVEDVLGKSMADIQNEFDYWFERLHW